MESMTKEQMFSSYPNQWVLIGDPVMESIQGSVRDILRRGVVLFAGKTKMEVAENAHLYRDGFASFACIYTGEISTGMRKWVSVRMRRSNPRTM
jgi:hypothetical protein